MITSHWCCQLVTDCLSDIVAAHMRQLSDIVATHLCQQPDRIAFCLLLTSWHWLKQLVSTVWYSWSPLASTVLHCSTPLCQRLDNNAACLWLTGLSDIDADNLCKLSDIIAAHLWLVTVLHCSLPLLSPAWYLCNLLVTDYLTLTQTACVDCRQWCSQLVNKCPTSMQTDCLGCLTLMQPTCVNCLTLMQPACANCLILMQSACVNHLTLMQPVFD